MSLSEHEKSAQPHFVQGMGLWSATAIVVGSMIGSGIFIVSADIARAVDSPALLIAAWLITIVMTMVGALSYGELAAMMPKAGGQYIYLREALSPLWGFLYGWTLFLVIQTGTIAAIGVAFAKFLGVFFPAVSGDHWLLHMGHVPALRLHVPGGDMVLGNIELGLNTANLVAIAIIVVLTLVNLFGVKLGAFVQDIFTTAKTLALAALVLLGLFFARNAQAVAANFGAGWHNFWTNSGWHAVHPVEVGAGGPISFVGIFTVLAVVQVGSLFSADAWNNVTFTAGEIKNPRRNLPLSLALGTGLVLSLYLLANFVYLMALPLHGDPHATTLLGRGIQFATDDRVGTALMEQVFHSAGAKLMAAAILVSTFGAANGMILAGARVYYAMSRDGLFFRSIGKLSPRYKTPIPSLLLQGAWSCLLCLSGTYNQLLDFTMFAALLFYIATIGGLFVLRFKRPDADRPYRAFGYPILPALYIAMAAWICAVLLRYKPQFTWPGLIIVLLGVPAYWIFRRSTEGETKI